MDKRWTEINEYFTCMSVYECMYCYIELPIIMG